MSRFLGAPAPAYTNLTLASGVTGTVSYVVVGGMCYIDVNPTFTSVTAGTAKTVVNAGGLPAVLCPTSAKRGSFSIGTTMGRVDVNTDGSIVVTPLTGSAAGATGFAVFPAGL